MFDASQLKAIMPKCPGDKLELYCKALRDAMIEGQITTLPRVAAFLGQLALESGELRYMREVWGPDKVPNQKRYERDFSAAWPPTAQDDRNKLAFRLGNSEKGDGFTFRGWGPIQNTGRGNTAKASQELFGDSRLLTQTLLLDDPAVGFRGAKWYWQSRNLNQKADALDFEGITLAINGGLTHLTERTAYYTKALGVLGRDFTIVA